MKTIFKLAFLLALLTIAQSNSQTWKELMDSAKLYANYHQDLEASLKWALKAEEEGKRVFNESDTNFIYTLEIIEYLYYSLGNSNDAIRYATRLCKLYIKTKGISSLDYLNAINSIGYFYTLVANFSDAEKYYLEALELYHKYFPDGNRTVAIMIVNVAVFYQNIGQYDKAEPLFNESLDMARRVFSQDDPDFAKIINNNAVFYELRSRFTEAEDLYHEAFEMNKRMFKGDHSNLIITNGNLGSFYEGCGKYSIAEPYYKEALDMSRRLYKSDHPDLAQSLNNMAYFYDLTGKFIDAEPLFMEALEMRRRLYQGDHPDLAMSINNMGYFLEGRGRLEEAERFYIESYEMNKRLFKGDHPNLVLSLNNLAAFYVGLSRFSQAEPLYKEAIEMNRRLLKGDHPELEKVLYNCGIFYMLIGHYAKAEPILIESLDMCRRLFRGDHPDLARNIHNMAIFFREKGDYQKAESLYTEALEMRRRMYKSAHPDIANCLHDFASLYEIINNLKLADKFIFEALNIYLILIEDIFRTSSEREKEQFWRTCDKKFESFYSYVLKRAEQNNAILINAFEYQLSIKGLLLSSTLKIKNRIYNSNNSRLAEEYTNWIELKNLIGKYQFKPISILQDKNINIDSLILFANQLEKELSRLSDDFKKEYEKKQIKCKDVKISLDNNEAAIELVRFKYFDKRWTDTVYYAALIIKNSSDDSKSSDDSVQLVLLKNGNDLEGKYIEEYRNQAGQFKKRVYDPDKVNDKLKELYSQFWAPVQEKLKGIKTVYLSPDGVYNLLNLNTLINPETGKYLLDEMDLRLVTSTRDLVNRRLPVNPLQEGDTPLNPLSRGENIAELFGDPQFDLDSTKYELLASNIKSNPTREYYFLGNALDSTTRGAIASLPGTRKEIENITGSFQKQSWQVNSHLGPEALEEALKAVDNPRVLHIATHGKFLKDVERRNDERMMGFETQRFVENPLLRSMLLFSGAENTLLNQGQYSAAQREDGLLTAYEAQNLNLDNTELVVLSACETGLGEIKNGEGVYGLQRAFQVAGAKSLIMSLWTVSDKATQELMSSFYDKWLSGKEKRTAFREAQMELKKKYPGFYYWGAFVMVGE